MRLHLLGTGCSDGWPNPWCACASCRAAAADGVLRGQTCALVDGRLALELGAEAPRAAVRAGVSLAGLDAVLVTHAHPDHCAWEPWMWRGWSLTPRPVTLVAPPAALAAVQQWLDPSVTTVAVRTGDRFTVAGFEVVALAARHAGPEAGPSLLYDLTGPDGSRLLWGCDTGLLPADTLEQVTGRRYDAVVLELTSARQSDHLDLRTWPETVAELRRRGAVTAATHVLAAHLGHGNPPPHELDALLASWGARAPRDGDVVDLGDPPTAPATATRTLVLGGASSGKSAFAEQLLAAEPDVVYVATAPDRPGDAEWTARVRAHVDRRPAGWRTLETADAAGVLAAEPAAVLVDDLGLWLTRLLDESSGWDGPVPEPAVAAADALVDAWRARSAVAVLVAPQVGGGVVPDTASGRRFRDLLGRLTARLAAGSDSVVEVVAGLPRRVR